MSKQHQAPILSPYMNTTATPREQAAEEALLYRLAACRWENHHAHRPVMLTNLPW